MMGRLARCVAAVVLLASAATAQGEDVEIQTVDVAPGVSMLIGQGGNIGVSTGADGVFLVDDQFAPLTPKILAAVAKLSDAPVRFVLNTHWHGDHTGGNENLAGQGALIVAHDNVRRRMSSDQFISAMDRRVPASPPAALPVVTFGADVTLHWNGDALHAIHVPNAHTDGDAIVHFEKAEVVHTGDVYFAGQYPFIDRDSGGSLGGMIAAVDRVLALADDATRIIPGHGPLSNRAELARYRAMLATARDRVRAAIDAGKSLEEVLAARPLADLDGAWGTGFVKPEAFLRTVYASLAAD
jgi:glyoxylase-like metal-dependent hydrolase (beta-lactamase superfamily II)